MGNGSAPNLRRFLPHAIVATAVVMALPITLVSLLATVKVLGSVFISGPLAMLISLAASAVAAAWWKKRPDSHDLVFSDLMIWGWLRRARNERRLSRAVELLGADSEVPRERQVAWLEELAGALEARDPYTHGHSRRVTAHAVAIAERMGLSREHVAKIRTAAAIHDVGKLRTPRQVLNKPGRLSDEEFEVIKRHPVDGAEMAVQLGDDEITAMVRHHHERLDGSGYPDRLKGDQIPLGARIIAVADTFDAITSKRPYRSASSHKKAITILVKESGTQLDPDAVRAFSSHYSGRRGVALGALLTSLPSRLLAWQWGSGSASLTNSVAALAVAGALGGSAAVLAKPAPHRALPARPPGRSHAGPRTDTPRGANSASPIQVTQATRAGARGGAAHHVPRGSSHQSSNRGSRQGTSKGSRPGPTQPAGGASSSGGQRVGSSPGGVPASTANSPSSRGSSPNTGPRSVTTTPPSVSPPSATVTTPSVTVGTPAGSVTTPSATATAPGVTVTTPGVTVTIPRATVTTPGVTTPGVTVTTPSVPIAKP